mmetsp:Transcript_33766/g.69743  ORF Transcript_33766/g.69743 Transcript_33766/m.69743 type:complete len:208 (-) Transcript_33766:539-1162(-)
MPSTINRPRFSVKLRFLLDVLRGLHHVIHPLLRQSAETPGLVRQLSSLVACLPCLLPQKRLLVLRLQRDRHFCLCTVLVVLETLSLGGKLLLSGLDQPVDGIRPREQGVGAVLQLISLLGQMGEFLEVEIGRTLVLFSLDDKRLILIGQLTGVSSVVISLRLLSSDGSKILLCLLELRLESGGSSRTGVLAVVTGSAVLGRDLCKGQ